ncbi:MULTISPECIES: phage tail tape measure protein [unclassified Gilliamella]|uniref:phage tail tape measure protein n=1 Tax=unclassified Gilliamella TaxID=2685620 RepID=UPI00080E4654|nr:phage tail tape measure protein [Gilliamella apicola]OCG35525.1 phage tail tape measure protein [Gilliamella apicola]OCG48616.1 phage tail tape measure protein [Gilliamella apicola]OCG50343.1 phage tail tape measure protein [Gilliamella apicola]
MNDLQLKITLNGIDKTSRPLRNIKGGAKGLAQQIKETKEKLSQLNDLQKNLDGFAKLKQQVKDSRKAFNDARDKVKLLSEQFTNTSSSTKKMRRELEKAKKEANKLKDSFISLASKQRRQYTEFIRAGISTKNIINHQETLKSKIVATTQALEQQNLKWDKYNTHLKKLNNIRAKYDTGMQRVAILGGVGYGALSTGRTVARGMKNILGVGYQFDASMSATQAVTRIDDKNDPRMLALRKQARELPLVSKFTDSEVAQGQYFLGRTGYNPDQILKAMPGMLNLSAAGDVDLGTTADIASNIQMAMGLPAEKMDHVADVLTAMFTRNNVDIPMLGESLKYSAGVGASFGQSLETISTLTAVMGNAGIQGSQAGTTLRQILVRLGTSNAVAKLGVKVADKNGNMRDVIDIMSEISEATKHMGNVQRAQINKQIAGQIGLTGFEVLLTQASTGFLKKMRGEQGEYDGEAARVAKTKLDNLAGDMTMLHAAFENISVELFEKNNDWLRSAIQGLTKFLHGIGEFLKKHPALSKALVVIGAGLAAITTAFGAFAIMLMSVFGPMLMTRFILSRLGLSLGGFFTKTNIASGGLKALGRALLAIAGSPIKTFGAALKGLGFIFTSVGRAFLFTPIGLAITAIIAVIVIAALVIRKYWEPIKAWFIGFWEGLKESLSPVVEEFSYLEPFVTTIGDGFKWLGEKISGLINWFCDLFKPVELTKEEFQKTKEAGKSFGNTIGTAIKSLIWLFKKLQEIIVNTIKDLFSIPQKIGELAKKIEETLTGEGNFFNKFTKIGSYIADGLIDGVNNKYGNIKVTMSNLGTNISNWFKSTLDIHSPSRVFAKFGGYTIDGYIHGIEHNQSDAFRSMSQLGKSISNRFKNTLDIHSPSRLFAKFGGHTVDGYVNGIERNQNDAIQSVGQLANNIITTGSQLSSGVIVDNRRPISGTSSVSPQYYITINATPSMNEQELARCVAKEIERRERNQSARYRSSLRDID